MTPPPTPPGIHEPGPAQFAEQLSDHHGVGVRAGRDLLGGAAGTVDGPDADTAAPNRMHATNYLGVIAVIRAASRVLRGGSRIITVSSGLGSRVGVPGVAD